MVGTRVFIGGLSRRASERDIDRFFKNYSRRMGDIIIKNGFAFVEFDDDRDAEDAIYELNGKELLGTRVTVERARGTPRNGRQRGATQPRYNRPPPRRRYGAPSRTRYRLVVQNLSSKVSWQDLKDFMRQAGEVTYADAHKTRKNEGIIEFATHSDMRNALIKLDGKELNGRRIRLVEESLRRSRSGTPSRSRSRSPHARSSSASRSQSRERSRSESLSRSRSGSSARNHESPKKAEGRDRASVEERVRRRNSPTPESRSPSRSLSKERMDRHRDSRHSDYNRSYSKSPSVSGDERD